VLSTAVPVAIIGFFPGVCRQLGGQADECRDALGHLQRRHVRHPKRVDDAPGGRAVVLGLLQHRGIGELPRCRGDAQFLVQLAACGLRWATIGM
jgi:hypothetical protein